MRQSLAGLLVHLYVKETCLRVLALQGILFGRRDEVLAFLGRQGNSLYSRGFIADARVPNTDDGSRHGLHHRRGAVQLIDQGLEVALAERVFLEVAIGTRLRGAAEQLDVTRGPCAGEALVSPAFDVLAVTAFAGRGN